MRVTSRPRYPPPIIVPAERADIPDLVRVYIEAESSNVLLLLQPHSKKKRTLDMIQLMEENWDNPRAIFMKALDADTKEITAMAVWQLYGYDLKALDAHNSNKNTLYPFDLSTGMLLAKAQEDDPSTALGKYIQSQADVFYESWCKPTRHLFLALLMTEPRFQRRGIGTAMLNRGHERADRDGVPSFLIASPVGHPLYRSVGWKEVSSPLRVDLRDWAPYAQSGDMGWGIYKFYYMLRLPRTATL